MYKKKSTCVISLLLAFLLLFCACGTDTAGAGADSVEDLQKVKQEDTELAGRKPVSRMELLYAENFAVEYYDGGLKLITIFDGTETGSRFLVTPKGTQAPSGIDEDIVVFEGAADCIYLAATAVMDHFCRIGAIDAISLSGTKASGWYIDEARRAMEEGRILYAGKYSSPDYELILQKGCRLAIESMMISHSPEVKEQLERNGIPVLVDLSSYESHPLGRSEWIRLYGALTDHEDEAEAVFSEQAEKLESILADEMKESAGTDASGGKKTVAFFYISSSGSVSVRKSNDYMAQMIELAGGKYVFDDLGSKDSDTGTTMIQMEDFYAAAKDADYLIYNTILGEEIETLDQLIAKNSLLSGFKAVKSGNVYCTGKNMYQESSSIGTMVLDIYRMLQGGGEEMQFLYHLE